MTAAKIKNGAVGASKIANGAIGASQLNTAGLTVPSATKADTANSANTANTANSAKTATTANTATTAESANSANSVGGFTIQKLSFIATNGTGPTTLLNVGGVALVATCTGTTNVTVATTVPAYAESYSINGSSEVHNRVNSDSSTVIPATSIFPDNDSTFEIGTTNVLTRAGQQIRIQWQSDNGNAATAANCMFTGTATIG